ncbi:hypothetical protein [Neorhizobium sp. T7_12]|uniref:hypothetical protein n=1 Tax=Neorhizobium sp. T7_12 TaxID=2093832 RepID=UPI000CF8A1F7|nr:hypothetical protein [Neorhizobium sp. T7_12]
MRIKFQSPTDDLRFPINLLDDQSVVTKDGEYLGTWGDIDDAIYTFTPDGHTDELCSHPFISGLCERIEDWMKTR